MGWRIQKSNRFESACLRRKVERSDEESQPKFLIFKPFFQHKQLAECAFKWQKDDVPTHSDLAFPVIEPARRRHEVYKGTFWQLKVAVLLWIIAITTFHLFCAAKGRSIYRDIHMGTALEYSKGTINLLRPIIVGFNLNKAPTPQEFPLWQASAGYLMKTFGQWFGWGNLASLVFAFSALVPLFGLARAIGDEETAWWTILLFLSQPLIFVYAGEGSPDGQALAACVWFMFFAYKLVTGPKILWLILTILTGSLASVSKLPFFVTAGFGCFLWMFYENRRSAPAWLFLGISATAITVIFFIWNSYVNRCYALAEFPFVDLRFSQPEMKFWYFGDLHYRTSPSVWIKGAWRALYGLYGSFGLAPLLLCLMFRKRSNNLPLWWLAGGVVSAAIFFHIVFHHSHYYLMFSPVIAMLGAEVVVWLQSLIVSGSQIRSGMVIGCGIGVLVLSVAQGLHDQHAILLVDNYPYAMARIIKENTSNTDKILLQGGGWGGQLLFLSEREGLSIWDTKMLENPATYRQLKDLGFSKLVMVSQSPLLAAIEHSTSASPDSNRVVYEPFTTPIVNKFPTLVKTSDILIQTLP